MRNLLLLSEAYDEIKVSQLVCMYLKNASVSIFLGRSSAFPFSSSKLTTYSLILKSSETDYKHRIQASRPISSMHLILHFVAQTIFCFRDQWATVKLAGGRRAIVREFEFWIWSQWAATHPTQLRAKVLQWKPLMWDTLNFVPMPHMKSGHQDSVCV